MSIPDQTHKTSDSEALHPLDAVLLLDQIECVRSALNNAENYLTACLGMRPVTLTMTAREETEVLAFLHANREGYWL